MRANTAQGDGKMIGVWRDEAQGLGVRPWQRRETKGLYLSQSVDRAGRRGRVLRTFFRIANGVPEELEELDDGHRGYARVWRGLDELRAGWGWTSRVYSF
jgi:hypothetical protein